MSPARCLAVSLLLFLTGFACGTQPHGTHWKGGAGLWHPVNETLPRVGSPVESARLGLDLGAESLTVTPSVVSVGDTVTVSWSFADSSLARGLGADAFHEDWIGVYCPATATDEDYLDWLYIPTTGKSVQFGPLVNMRCEYQFRYLRYGKSSYVAVASSPNVGFKQGSSQPTQGRLSESGVAGTMDVMWVSDLSTAAASTVQYVSSAGGVAMNVTGTSHTYNASDMCNKPATEVGAMKFRDPGYMHSVTLTGLKSASIYSYRFGTDGHWSDWFNFTTQAAPGDTTPLDFFVYGDLGEWRSAAGTPPGDRAYTTMGHIEHDLMESGRQFNMLLHVGDISYARGVSYQWEQFGNLIQPVAARIPYHVCIGNHEYDHEAGGEKDPSHAEGQGYHPSWGNYGSDSGGECAVPVVNRFQMPSTSRGSRPPFWYSHDYGMVHMLWLSTEHDYYPGSEMHDFMVADLEAVNRTRTPWVFLMGHRPMYTSQDSSPSDEVVQAHQQEAYEDVLQKYGVDAFFTGHYHSYERTCALYRGECHEEDGVVQSTVHLMVGMAGASHDPDKYKTVPWTRSHSTEYGYGRVHVANATHLFFEYVRNDSGEVGDSAWIVSDHKWQGKASTQWV